MYNRKMEIKEKNPVSVKTVFKYYARAFTPRHKKLYVLSIFFQIIRTGSFVISPYIYKKIFDYLSTTTLRGEIAFSHILSLLSIILIIRVIAWISARFLTFILAKLLPEVNTEARSSAYDYLIRHSYTFFTNNFVGALTQKVNKYADSLWNLSDRFTNDFLPLFIKIVGILTVLFFVDRRLAFGMSAWIAVFLIISFSLSRKRKPISLARSLALTKTNAHLSDTISNQNSIALFGASAFESVSFRDVINVLKDAFTKRNIFDVKVNAVYSAFITIIEILVIGGSLYLWSKGEITLGTIVLIQSYIITLIDDIWGFSRIVQAVEESYADAKEMVEILETPHEIQDDTTAQKLIVSDGVVAFENVTFSYNNSIDALKDINILIKKGEKIGLVGPSGAGKSTFVKLLLRFFDVTGGSIKIDGVDIREVTQDSLHNAIGFVPQDPSLFHRSLLENIGYGNRDATEEEIIDAAKKAHAHEFISKLPDGYHTLVGERGIKLSGGERQRVAIARAILKNAPILLLDEATSALDSESERLIQDALNVLMKNKTVIVIAHRLSTIQHMDRILVTDQGKIKEEGSHASLLKKRGSMYKKLWELQAGGFIKDD